ncbi:MAG: hypothetical protein M1822_004520 [Bathelium mastoideum]|nr:MAG: hypothetical protein M1822_004520 [Bathelium mastoideum]
MPMSKDLYSHVMNNMVNLDHDKKFPHHRAAHYPAIISFSSDAPGISKIVSFGSPLTASTHGTKENTNLANASDISDRVKAYLLFSIYEFIPRVDIAFNIHFQLPQPSTDTKDRQQVTSNIRYQLGDIKLNHQGSKEVQKGDGALFPGFSEIDLKTATGHQAFRVAIKSLASVTQASNIFPADPEFGSHSQKFEILRDVLSAPHTITILTKGEDVSAKVFDTQIKIDQAMSTKVHPCKVFYPCISGNSMVLRPGHIEIPPERPKEGFRGLATFKDLHEWQTALGMACFEADEYRSSLNRAVKVKIQLVRFPSMEIPIGAEGEAPEEEVDVDLVGSPIGDLDDDLDLTRGLYPPTSTDPQRDQLMAEPSTAQPAPVIPAKSIGDRRYLGIIPNPEGTIKARPDEFFTLNFDEYHDSCDYWRGRVLDPIPYADIRNIVVQIDRPFKRGYDRTDLQTASLPQLAHLNTPQDVHSALQQPDYLDAWFHLRKEDRTTKREIRSINAAMKFILHPPYDFSKRRLKRMLLGNRFDNPIRTNLFAEEKNPENGQEVIRFPAADTTKLKADSNIMLSSLNQGQQKVILGLENSPDGLTLVHGAAGTGKTQIIKIAVTLLALQRTEIAGPAVTKANPWAALVVVPINEACNDLVEDVYNFAKQYLKREPLVGRLYPSSIEDAIIKQQAHRVRPKRPQIDIPVLGSVDVMLAGQ